MNNRLDIAKEFANKIKSDDIQQIILFGSVARGNDDKYSDIDILIVSENTDKIMDFIIDIATDILLEKEELIMPHLMTTDHYNRTKNYPFLSNVLKEGVKIG